MRVPRDKAVGDWKYDKVRVPRPRRRRSQSQTLQDPSQLRQNPNLPRYYSAVDGTICGSATDGYTSPSTPTPSGLRQLGSPSYVDDVSGVHTPPSEPTPTHSCLRQLGSRFHANDAPLSTPTPSGLRQFGSPLYENNDLQDMKNILDIGMSPMRGSGPGLTSTVSSVFSRNKDSVDANASFCAPRQKVAREMDVSVLNPQRTLRMSPAECEGAIEELSKALEEGFFAMLDGLVEDFDKPGGIGDMIDKNFERNECFENLDKLEKKLKSEECVCGKWASKKGESMIFFQGLQHEPPHLRGTCGRPGIPAWLVGQDQRRLASKVGSLRH